MTLRQIDRFHYFYKISCIKNNATAGETHMSYPVQPLSVCKEM